MKTILHIICSPRGKAAESYRLSQGIVDQLRLEDPAATVIERVLADHPLAHVDPDFALSQHGLADVSDAGTAAVSKELIDELESADVVVIGTPIHNFTVPSALKAWMDHVVRVRLTFDVTPAGKVGKLRDRPVFIAFSSGGRFSGDGARQPDFFTSYIEAVLGIIGLHDLRFVSVQGTVFGPEALAQSREQAQSAVRAHFPSRAE